MKSALYPIVVVLVFCFGCSSDAEDIASNDEVDELPATSNLYYPPLNSPNWETTSVDELGWDALAEQELYDFLETNDSKAFIILKDGKIVVEWYFGDHTQNTSWYWASAGKTLTAFMVGIAQQQDLLNIEDKTSDYLGTGWTSATIAKEGLITITDQLSMTSGLNELLFECVTPDCLQYVADAGSRWSYHNGPYTLLQDVVANAANMEWSNYFNANLRNRIGMEGFWFTTNDNNNVYFSTARSMARFGLLNLGNGIWNGETLLDDNSFLNAMKNTSQNLNASYGYLWWLNGKESFMSPASRTVFDGPLIPNAPSDTYAGLGKNDQKLYIVPSEGLVIVRQGEDAGEDQLGPSSFDNGLWEKLTAFMN